VKIDNAVQSVVWEAKVEMVTGSSGLPRSPARGTTVEERISCRTKKISISTSATVAHMNGIRQQANSVLLGHRIPRIQEEQLLQDLTDLLQPTFPSSENMLNVPTVISEVDFYSLGSLITL